MHPSMHKQVDGDLILYTCDRIAVPHAFTTKFGGVSTGHCASLNFGYALGDVRENVTQNYHILSDALGLPFDRLTMTRQVHQAQVATVTPTTVGMGLHQPFTWDADALVTNLPNTPLTGFYADCVVTLLYDPVQHACGVCHSGWRGTAGEILPNAIAQMHRDFGSQPQDIIAVLGPSICQDCFETDADVPDAMRLALGDMLDAFVTTKGVKFHVDLRAINAYLLQKAGLLPENVIDSGICTMCLCDTFWSHRATKGVRGVQAGVIMVG